MSPRAPVGMIGLGLMGTALSARLIDAGTSMMGFDVDSAQCNAFRDIGAKPARSAADMMTRCHTVVVAIYGSTQAQLLLPMTLVQADLLRKAVTRLGREYDSAAIIKAIRPSRNTGAAS
jgi:6-phosphogluconate dehydrogenase (decarboxylating)